MLDSIVQLLRNGLCVIKGLELFQISIPLLWNNQLLFQQFQSSTLITFSNWIIKTFAIPQIIIQETTPLEFCIGICQFYAFVSMSISGITMIYQNYYKYISIQYLIQQQLLFYNPILQTTTTKKKKKNEEIRNDDDDDEQITMITTITILKQSIIYELHASYHTMIIGILLICIGCSFFILFTNSIHITELGWNGGIAGVIHAVTVMEISLVPLLYYMYVDANQYFRKVQRLRIVQQHLLHLMQQQEQEESNTRGKDNFQWDIITFETLTNWKPYWKEKIYENINLFDVLFLLFSPSQENNTNTTTNEMNKKKIDEDNDKNLLFQLLQEEIDFVRKSLSIYIPNNNTNNNNEMKDENDHDIKRNQKDKDTNGDDDDDDDRTNNNNNNTMTTRMLTNNDKIMLYENKIKELYDVCTVTKYMGYREYIYLLINTIAFYSYLLCVIAYYYHDETMKPYYIHTMLFGLNNDDADWHGNFWGDLMWTIEPILSLSTTYYFHTTTMEKTKNKSNNNNTTTTIDQSKMKVE